MDDKTLLRVIRGYKTQVNAIARAEDRRVALAAEIKHEMRERGVDTLRLGSHCVTLRDVVSMTVDVGALREGAPDVAKLYQVERTVPRLTVS